MLKRHLKICQRHSLVVIKCLPFCGSRTRSDVIHPLSDVVVFCHIKALQVRQLEGLHEISAEEGLAAPIPGWGASNKMRSAGTIVPQYSPISTIIFPLAVLFSKAA